MWEVTHSCVCHDALIRLYHDQLMCVCHMHKIRLSHMCNMIHSYLCVPWLSHLWPWLIYPPKEPYAHSEFTCNLSDTPLRALHHRALSAKRATIGILPQKVPCIHLPDSHTLQHTHCNTMQRTLQSTATHTRQHAMQHCNAHTAQQTATQHHALCPSSPQHTATHRKTLQDTAAHCNTLQATATQYHTRHHESPPPSCQEFATHLLQHTANTLQHSATHCNALQHTIPHCNTLQHTATHCCFKNIISWARNHTKMNKTRGDAQQT